MNWRFAYLIGFHPWEDAAADPPFVAKAAEPFAREETGPSPPSGRTGSRHGQRALGHRAREARLAGHGGRLCEEGPAARPGLAGRGEAHQVCKGQGRLVGSHGVIGHELPREVLGVTELRVGVGARGRSGRYGGASPGMGSSHKSSGRGNTAPEQ
jgi:hypothetical protein